MFTCFVPYAGDALAMSGPLVARRPGDCLDTDLGGPFSLARSRWQRSDHLDPTRGVGAVLAVAHTGRDSL